MATVINYNRSRLNNIQTVGSFITVTPGTSPLLLLEMGIDVTVPQSFLEIMSSVGFAGPDSPLIRLTLTVNVDGVRRGESDITTGSPNSVQLSFHTILENLPVGHHVIQLFATTDEEIGIDGPVTMSAWVLA